MSKSNATKKCKHCKAEIPAKSKVCPNCNKKQGGILKWVVIGTVCIALCAPAVDNSDSDTSTDTSRTLDVAAVSSQEPMETLTSEPTVAPTPVPTAVPTPVSTVAPTPEPTAAPTPVPTIAPTPVPTIAPTPEPTAAPTPVPTIAPTPEPTAAPTPVPTAAPTPEPTAAPSESSVLVWIDDTAKRYHRKNGCGMDNAYQVTLEEAIAKGKTPCGRCYK